MRSGQTLREEAFGCGKEPAERKRPNSRNETGSGPPTRALRFPQQVAVRAQAAVPGAPGPLLGPATGLELQRTPGVFPASAPPCCGGAHLSSSPEETGLHLSTRLQEHRPGQQSRVDAPPRQKQITTAAPRPATPPCGRGSELQGPVVGAPPPRDKPQHRCQVLLHPQASALRSAWMWLNA